MTDSIETSERKAPQDRLAELARLASAEIAHCGVDAQRCGSGAIDAPPVAIPAEVVEAAQRMKANGYRGPLAWARLVIDWVAASVPAASQPAALTEEQWYDIASAHANHDWSGSGFLASVKSVGAAALAAAQSQPVATAPDSAQQVFEAFVRQELGDVAVMDEGRYISPKIQKYWLTWQASRAALAAAPQAVAPTSVDAKEKMNG